MHELRTHETPSARAVLGGDEVAALHRKLDALTATLERVAERQARQDELVAEIGPIARLMMGEATERLSALEQQGWFRLLAGLQQVGAQVASHYEPEDYEQLADAVVGMLDTVRNLTQPDVLAVGNEVGDVIHHAGELAPMSVVGMARASQEPDVQRGLAVLFEVLRHVGRAAGHVDRASRQPPPRRGSVASATPARASASASSARSGVAGASAASPSASPHCAPRPGASADAAVDPSAWTPEIGEALAIEAGITLTDAHREVLRAAREEHQKSGVSPNIRRLTQVAGIGTRELYALFPRAPARTVARLAGLPKPAGCI